MYLLGITKIASSLAYLRLPLPPFSTQSPDEPVQTEVRTNEQATAFLRTPKKDPQITENMPRSFLRDLALPYCSNLVIKIAFYTHSNHTGFLTISQTHQACIYLRAFVLAASYAWNALSPEFFVGCSPSLSLNLNHLFGMAFPPPHYLSYPSPILCGPILFLTFSP